MSRYIDADKVLVDAVKQRKFFFAREDLFRQQIIVETVYSDLAEFLDSQPTADVEEVVRCKDCKYSDKATYVHAICCDFLPKIMKPTDFCSYGERRKDES